MTETGLKAMAVNSLEDMKAEDITLLNVSNKTSITDWLVIASGTSSRHVKSIANNVVVAAKKVGIQPLGVEGDDIGEWVLVDLGDVIVHVMQKQVREFYDLESLWQIDTGSLPENRKPMVKKPEAG